MIKLYPHQEKAVRQLQTGSILLGGTGSGKTITALAYYVERVCEGEIGELDFARPMDIYVITTAKKRDSLDWEHEAAKFKIFKRADELPHQPVSIHVDSWNNIEKYEGIRDAFFVFDEQKVVGSGAWSKSFIKIAKRNEWILLSATPGDTWLDYIPVFVANGFYQNRTDFKREHVVYSAFTKFPKVERYLNVGKLVRLRNEILVYMPYQMHTTRKSMDVAVDYDKDLFDLVVKKRWHVYENRPLRDVAELFIVMRKVVNSDESRLQEVISLLNKHPRLIVFYNFDYELEMLRSLVSSSQETSSNEPSDTDLPITNGHSLLTEAESFVTTKTRQSTSTRLPSLESDDLRTTTDTPIVLAEWNGHRHDPIPTTNRWVYLVQYAAGAEGWNCVQTDAMCFYSQTYSYKMYHQAHGRIDRLNTPYETLHYYNLISDSPIDAAIRKALKEKRNFNERDLRIAT